ncbi:hypothetical protein C0Q70_14158 [Pomacea canaliculata]|uniref:Arginase n=1 Tax=Pomacea canaliculata TaxID=400727 RepID=A0A2T7NZ78_POMCA|nr:hypothetical protein C0Q70_14158 [Pomacea canaliculata]
MDRAVGVIGIPFCRGQPREGTELAPSYLRKGQIISKIQSLSKEVTDYGDLELGDVEKDAPWKLVKYPLTVGYANQKIANEVASITKDKMALVLGGDHSIAMGSIIGHARSSPNLVVVGKRPIHVSFDVDALDPEFTPSTGTAVAGGLSLREGLYIAEEISRTGRLSVLDVVELNPALGTQQQSELTVETTIEVVTHFFGKRREGNTRPPQVPPSA